MAAIQSNYSINIAEARDTRSPGETMGYRHWAKLELGPRDRQVAIGILADTRERYPEPGFKVEMTYWDCVGTKVEG